jgi:transposase
MPGIAARARSTRFLRADTELRQYGLAQLVALGDTLNTWSEEIARMWRFTRSNGITEGFHNKMETISRQACGFRNLKTTGNVSR